MHTAELTSDWRVPLRAALAGAALLMSGCVESRNDSLPDPAPSVVTDEHRGPCMPIPLKGGGTTSYFEKDDAEQCASYMEGGVVHLINFGVDSSQAKAVGERMQHQLKLASDGLLNMTVRVVNASPAAESVLYSSTPTGCSNANIPEHQAAYAADTAMPELGERDIKVALSTIPACEPNLRGSSDFKGEYVNIFWNTIAPKERVDEAAFIGAHELLHNFQLGHNGRIFQVLSDGRTKLLHGEKRETFDLNQYLVGCKYQEYSVDPTAVMGDPSIKQDFTLDPLHLNTLRWPQIALEGEQASYETFVGSSWVSLTPKGAAEGRFMTTRLNEPINLRDQNLPKNTRWDRVHQFTKLAFRPISPDGKTIHGFGLYLVDDAANIANFGILAASTDVATIMHGTQQFQVRLQGQALQIREVGR